MRHLPSFFLPFLFPGVIVQAITSGSFENVGDTLVSAMMYVSATGTYSAVLIFFKDVLGEYSESIYYRQSGRKRRVGSWASCMGFCMVGLMVSLPVSGLNWSTGT
jgi:hypothetical protein